ncbi:MAG TPA: hypothetical protein VGO58_11690 [Chitinophagaceae bacterium]|jgi:hypothetical protein|nr:hypothetical protein [Chitinophagaceae bacterium]
MKQLLILPFIVLALFSFSQNTESRFGIEKHNCPVCRSDKDVIPIVYGKPATGLIQKAERGECRLGGCVLDKDSPHFYCKKDKKEF